MGTAQCLELRALLENPEEGAPSFPNLVLPHHTIHHKEDGGAGQMTALGCAGSETRRAGQGSRLQRQQSQPVARKLAFCVIPRYRTSPELSSNPTSSNTSSNPSSNFTPSNPSSSTSTQPDLELQPDPTLGTGYTPSCASAISPPRQTGVRFAEGVFGIPVGLESDSEGVEKGRKEVEGETEGKEQQKDGEEEEDKEEEGDWHPRARAPHVLVESVILRDRVRWVGEEHELDPDTEGDGGEAVERGEAETKDRPRVRVELVNPFDQATGSGRNVTMVVAGVARFFWDVGLRQKQDAPS
ncbi:unnamed protein product [Cyclocybe aegerita]|uniref:Uncharacterized protein n=1 Tax=Cyclocybe aegerita TaxID=1973307 RepID=A0A8S0WXT0_CYCAE|nr:unnamed protein product [Cyclocybe aegerita]